MRLRIAWIALRFAIVVAAALAPTLAGAADSTSASNTIGLEAMGPAAGAPSALDALPPDGSPEVTITGLQMMDDDDDFWNGWWVIMPIMMAVFWGGIIAVAVWGIRQFTKDRRGFGPLDIAKERLARGEISKDEFDRIKGDLA